MMLSNVASATISSRKGSVISITKSSSAVNNSKVDQILNKTVNPGNQNADLVTSITKKLTKKELQKQIKKLTDEMNSASGSIKDALTELNTAGNNIINKKEEVARECLGIAGDIEKIFGLSAASAVSSGIGSLAAGGALASGIVKHNQDKKIDTISKQEAKLKEEKTSDIPPEKLQDVLQQKFSAMRKKVHEIRGLLTDADNHVIDFEFPNSYEIGTVVTTHDDPALNFDFRIIKELKITDSQQFREFNNKVTYLVQNYSDDKRNRIYGLQEQLSDLIEDYRRTAGGKDSQDDKLQTEKDNMLKKSKMFGNIRTGLLGAATATSAVSMGTGIGATIDSKKLAEKMKNCNAALRNLHIENGKYTAAIENFEEERKNARDDRLLRQHTQVKENISYLIHVCHGFDNDNINKVKDLMTGTSVLSGVGTLTGITGTITSAMANKDGKNQKALNMTSNIMAGVTGGTSLTSSQLSMTAITSIKKDLDKAKECEQHLNSVKDLY